MLFSSFEFLYLFLPITLAVYFLLPRGCKNYVLLLASLVFYGFSSPRLLPLMLFVSVANWGFGLIVWRLVGKGLERRANGIVAFAVAFNVAVLAFFKYLDPIASALGFEPLGIELPSGISFYTFQAMSYVFDIRRRAARIQKNPLLFVTYVSLFPQLVAGPIVRYSDLDASLESREHSISRVSSGICLFTVGLGKKVLLANSAGQMWERMKLLSERGGTVLGAWLGIVFFAFQIYFDFSGYSDMARGLGHIFGFDFPENFRYPYTSRSITDFWRRWHITLSSWFREYIYIPLGGNRHGTARTYLNLLIVWSLTGIWHGAAYNFLLWGLYFFVILSLEKAFLLNVLERLPRVVCRGYALVLILLGWFVFASDTVSNVPAYLMQMFGIRAAFANNDSWYELVRNIPFLIILVFGSTPLPKRIFERFEVRHTVTSNILKKSGALLLLIICTCYLAAKGYNPFLYFRF